MNKQPEDTQSESRGKTSETDAGTEIHVSKDGGTSPKDKQPPKQMKVRLQPAPSNQAVKPKPPIGTQHDAHQSSKATSKSTREMSSGGRWQSYKIPKITVDRQADDSTDRNASTILNELIRKGVVTREQVSAVIESAPDLRLNTTAGDQSVWLKGIQS